MLSLKLRAVGTSTGLVLPKEMLAHLRKGQGETLYAIETPGGYVLTPLNPAVKNRLRAAKPYGSLSRRVAALAKTVHLYESAALDQQARPAIASRRKSCAVRRRGRNSRRGADRRELRPRTKPVADGHAKDLADLAAAYAFGFAKNHPFVDGNKRMAFYPAACFLK